MGIQKELLLRGEPKFGSIYGDEETRVVNKLLRESIKPSVGFDSDKETVQFEKDFCKLTRCKYSVALNGAGSAIDLVLKALSLKKEDEVISCTINFPGTHLSVIGSGAKLVLVEADVSAINPDPEDVRRKLSKNTKVILVTHMNGLAANISAIEEAINSSGYFKNKIRPKIICDAARALGTTYKSNHIGQEAWATVFSFHSYKMITTLGEGGMVVTDNEELASHLQDYRSFGRSNAWGSNFRMTKLQAGVGHVQLKKLKKLVSLRRKLAFQRNKILSNYSEITIQKDTDYSANCYYLYTIILPRNKKGEKRDEMIKILKEEFGVGCAIANRPTYQSSTLIKKHIKGQSLPTSDDLGERIICPVIHPQMTKETNEYVMNSFLTVYKTVFRNK